MKGDIGIEVDVEVDVERDRCFGCLPEVSKSVQVLYKGIEAVMLLTWEIPKIRGPNMDPKTVGLLL